MSLFQFYTLNLILSQTRRNGGGVCSLAACSERLSVKAGSSVGTPVSLVPGWTSCNPSGILGSCFLHRCRCSGWAESSRGAQQVLWGGLGGREDSPSWCEAQLRVRTGRPVNSWGPARWLTDEPALLSPGWAPGSQPSHQS